MDDINEYDITINEDKEDNDYDLLYKYDEIMTVRIIIDNTKNNIEFSCDNKFNNINNIDIHSIPYNYDNNKYTKDLVGVVMYDINRIHIMKNIYFDTSTYNYVCITSNIQLKMTYMCYAYKKYNNIHKYYIATKEYIEFNINNTVNNIYIKCVFSKILNDITMNDNYTNQYNLLRYIKVKNCYIYTYYSRFIKYSQIYFSTCVYIHDNFDICPYLKYNKFIQNIDIQISNEIILSYSMYKDDVVNNAYKLNINTIYLFDNIIHVDRNNIHTIHKYLLKLFITYNIKQICMYDISNTIKLLLPTQLQWNTSMHTMVEFVEYICNKEYIENVGDDYIDN